MNIVYGIKEGNSDKTYLGLLYVSLCSLFENHEGVRVDVYVIYSDLSEWGVKILSETAKHSKHSIHFIELPLGKYDSKLKTLITRYPDYNLGTFYRLFMGELLPENLSRVLYLDCDTIINKPLNEFYNEPFDGNLIIGTRDNVTSMESAGRFEKIAFMIHGPAVGRVVNSYINTGVILLDFKRVRKEFLSKCLSKINDRLIRSNYADQDLINLGYLGNIKNVDWRYNYHVTLKHRGKWKSLKDVVILQTSIGCLKGEVPLSSELREFLGSHYDRFSFFGKPSLYSRMFGLISRALPKDMIYALVLLKAIVKNQLRW